MKQRTNIILGVLVIILSIAEIVVAIIDFKIPMPINIFMSVMFIALGIKALYDVKK